MYPIVPSFLSPKWFQGTVFVPISEITSRPLKPSFFAWESIFHSLQSLVRVRR